MNVLHISTVDAIGGASRAAYRLHVGLQRLGQDSSMFVARRSSNDSTVASFRLRTDALGRLRRRMRREWIARSLARYAASRPTGSELFSQDRTQFGAALLSQLPPCDAINVHWVAGFVDHESFLTQVPKHTPVVWTLHDMNPFTGGCHYDEGCGRHMDQCGRCPQLGSRDRWDLSQHIWRRKWRALEQVPPGRLHIVSPSRWLSDEAERSSLLAEFPRSVIPYGLDTEVFSPRDRHVARTALEIPMEAGVVLFVAHSVSNRRKGMSVLCEALHTLDGSLRPFLVSVGGGKPQMEAAIPYRSLGYLDDDRMLALVYSAADLFVLPSLQDNLPNTVLESLACGTPIVGFEVGGIPDMVRPGVTGVLAAAGDVDALRTAIEDLLREPERRSQMSVMCREIAVHEYSLGVQAERYLQLYQSVVNQEGV